MGGVLGGGRTVVALYEIVPHGYGHARPGVEGYRYRAGGESQEPRRGADSAELLTVKVRYREPGGGHSRRLDVPLIDGGRSYDEASEDFRFTASVAAFGLVLRNSAHRGSASYRLAYELAGASPVEQRSEFRSLVRAAERFALD
jgi:Ca-activated chloride channel family protein